MAIRFTVDRHSYYEVLKMLDKIWVETLARLDTLEERVGRIELAGNYLPVETPEQEQEPEPKPEPKPEPEPEPKPEPEK